MERRVNVQTASGLWLERIVWNAAAGAVLAIMILVLLGSLQWLEAVAPATAGARPTVSAAGPSKAVEAAPSLKVHRPSG